MKEFFLRGFLSRDEMYVIYHQDINGSVHLAEFICRAGLDGVYKLICEFFAGDVERCHPGIMDCDVVGNRVHKVRFAQPDPAVYK